LAGSGDALARKAAIPRRTLETWLAGKAGPKALKIVSIARAAGVSVDWLITGEGDERAAGTSFTPQKTGAGYAHIPLYDVSARGGGSGVVVDNESVIDVLAFKEDWIRQELHTSPANLRLIYVEGDSMEPDLRAGDIILIDGTATSAKREGVYVIRMDDALIVKILQRLPGGVIKVVSRNSTYESFTVRADDHDANFTIVGRVVWACRRF